MQESKKKMDLRQLEEVMKEAEAGGRGKMLETKQKLVSHLDTTMDDKQKHMTLDSPTALQIFLDHIPISSIPGIKNSPVVELKIGDNVKDAIHMLNEKNVFGAPIVDVVDDPDATIGRISDPYMGFIDLPTMVHWSLEEFEKTHIQTKRIEDDDNDDNAGSRIFTLLEQNPQIGRTKVGELAKSFLWDPFFPVTPNDTLFHVMLLLSKHRVQVLPVVEQSKSQVIGYVTQNAVIQLLLQSSGLEWFDHIADKALSEFRFESEERVSVVYEDQSLLEALHILRGSRIGAVAVVNRGIGRIIGCIRNADVHLLLEKNELMANKKSLTAEEFIHLETSKIGCNPTIDRDLGALLSAAILHLRNNFLPRMDSPVTTKRSDTLKQAMKHLAETKSNVSFLIDDSQTPIGVLTLRDIIIQFAPPCMDSTIHGDSFFESALEQTGCQVRNRNFICNQ